MIITIDRVAHRALLEEFLQQLVRGSLDPEDGSIIAEIAEYVSARWSNFVLNLNEAEGLIGEAKLLADPAFVAQAVSPSFIDAANRLARRRALRGQPVDAVAAAPLDAIADEFALRLGRAGIANIGPA